MAQEKSPAASYYDREGKNAAWAGFYE